MQMCCMCVCVRMQMSIKDKKTKQRKHLLRDNEMGMGTRCVLMQMVVTVDGGGHR